MPAETEQGRGVVQELLVGIGDVDRGSAADADDRHRSAEPICCYQRILLRADLHGELMVRIFAAGISSTGIFQIDNPRDEFALDRGF